MALSVLGEMYLDLSDKKAPNTGALKAVVFQDVWTAATTLAVDFSSYFEKILHVDYALVTSGAIDADDAPINWSVSAGTVTFTRTGSTTTLNISGVVWGYPATA